MTARIIVPSARVAIVTTDVYTPIHLDWDGCLNVRDLGGLPLEGGGAIRERALVRSDSLSLLTPAGVEAARAYQLARIVDLRKPQEVERRPHPFQHEPVYANRPVQEHGDPTEGAWAELYISLLEMRPGRFARAMATVADAPDGPVLVHCAVGKDRTGLIVAMSLLLAGADREAVIGDYLLTNERLASVYADPAHFAAEPPARRTPPTRDAIERTLEHLDREHGGIMGYLTKGGFTEAQRDRLVERLV